jgi:tetratricopeptide (TPR) repeat protein
VVSQIREGKLSEINALDKLKEKGHQATVFRVLENKINIDFDNRLLKRHEKIWQITDQVITTNYDRAFELHKPDRVKKVIYNDDFHVARLSDLERFLFKIHGCIERPAECVLFSDQYRKLYSGKTSLALELFQLFSNKTIIFLGFSLNDPFVKDLLKLRQKAYRGLKHKNFIITTEEKEFSHLGVEKITTVKNYGDDLDTFLDELLAIRERYPYGLGMLLRGLEKEGKEFNEEDIRKKYFTLVESLHQDSNVTEEIEAGDFDTAEKKLQVELEESLSALESEKEKAAKISFEMGLLKQVQLKYKEALPHFRKAAELCPEDGHYFTELGFALDNLGHYDEAIETFQQAYDVFKAEPEKHHQNSMRSLTNIGMAWFNQGDHNEALRYFKEALELSEVSDDNHSITASIYNNVGQIFLKLGDYETAIASFESAYEHQLKKKTYEAYINIPVYHHSMASAYAHLKDYAKALKYLEASLAFFPEDDRNRPEVATIYNSLGFLNVEQGNIEAGMEFYRKSLKILNEIYDYSHPRIMDAMHRIADAMMKAGNLKQALDYIEKVLENAMHTYGPDHGETAEFYKTKASIYIHLKRYPEALEYIQKTSKIYKATFEEHPDMVIIESNTGAVYMALRQYDKAIKHLKRALKLSIKLHGKDDPNTEEARFHIELCQQLMNRDGGGLRAV